MEVRVNSIFVGNTVKLQVSVREPAVTKRESVFECLLTPNRVPPPSNEEEEEENLL